MVEEDKKALTIQQPWAALIMKGVKQIELRTWSTKYRGILYIHAAKVKNPIDPSLLKKIDSDPLNYGCVIGTVTLRDVKPLSRLDYMRFAAQHLSRYAWEPGLFGWFLENPVRFDTPLAYKGQLGLFTLHLDETNQ